MKSWTLPVLFILLFGCANEQEYDLAITNVTLIDGTGAAPREHVTIFVHEGRITAITDKSTPINSGSETIIDGTGKFVMPGLADTHVHFGNGGFVENENPTDRVLRQFLYYGVTSVLNVGGTHGSLEDIATLKKRKEAGDLIAPHIYATGGLITVPGSHPVATLMRLPEGADPETYDWKPRGVWLVETPEAMRAVIDSIADQGVSGVKIVVDSGPTFFGDNHPQMPPALIESAAKAANEHGLPVFAHATSPDELSDVVAANVRAVMHLVHEADTDAGLLDRMAEKGIFYVPTLSVTIMPDVWGDPAANLTDPFMHEGVESDVIESVLASGIIPGGAATAEDFQWRASVLQKLDDAHKAGVKIVAGTDTANPLVFPGYSTHHELALLVEAGLSPMEAIVVATRNAAEMLGELGEFGTIEPGKRADLLLLNENPLLDIKNTRMIDGVIAKGRVIDRAALFAD